MMDDVFANADARRLRNGLHEQDTGDGDQGWPGCAENSETLIFIPPPVYMFYSIDLP